MGFKFWEGGSTPLLVASNTLAQILGKIFTAGATFFITILIARSFGVEAYGDFTKVTTFVAIFYLLSDFGLNAVYLQRSESKLGTQDATWSTLLGLRLLGSLLLMFLAISLLAFIPQGSEQGFTGLVRLGIILFSPSIIFLALLTSANAVFQKNLRYIFSAAASSLGSIISLLLVWWVANSLVGATAVLGGIFCLLIGSAVTGLSALVLVRRLSIRVIPLFKWQPMLSLFWASLPLGLILIFNVVYFRIDSFILALSRSTFEVGIYGLAYKVFELPLVFPTFFMNALYPLLLTTENREPRTFLKLLKQSALFLVLSSLFLVAIIWAGAPLVSRVRPEFYLSVVPLRILSVGFPFFFLSSLTMWVLITLKKQSVLVWIYGGSMVVTVLLDVLFIPVYGYLAAAWITVLSETALLLVSGLVLTRCLSSSQAK